VQLTQARSCRSECEYALCVTGSQVTSHLRDKHNVRRDLRDGLTRYLRQGHLYSFRNPADVPLGRDGSLIHPKLQVDDGFACRECRYLTINHGELSRHISKKHLNGERPSRSRIDELYDDVFLQTWTNGPSREYWMVKKNGSTIRPVTCRGPTEHIQSIHERERERLRLDEEARSLSTDTGMRTLAGIRPWMERTRWLSTYQGVRRDILQRLAQMPLCNRGVADRFLGRGSSTADPDIVSPRQDEQKIGTLLLLVDRMLDRCEETVRHTGRTRFVSGQSFCTHSHFRLQAAGERDDVATYKFV